MVTLPPCGREGQWFLLGMGVISSSWFVGAGAMYSSLPVYKVAPAPYTMAPPTMVGPMALGYVSRVIVAGTASESHLPRVGQAMAEQLSIALPSFYGRGQEMRQ